MYDQSSNDQPSMPAFVRYATEKLLKEVIGAEDDDASMGGALAETWARIFKAATGK